MALCVDEMGTKCMASNRRWVSSTLDTKYGSPIPKCQTYQAICQAELLQCHPCAPAAHHPHSFISEHLRLRIHNRSSTLLVCRRGMLNLAFCTKTMITSHGKAWAARYVNNANNDVNTGSTYYACATDAHTTIYISKVIFWTISYLKRIQINYVVLSWLIHNCFQLSWSNFSLKYSQYHVYYYILTINLLSKCTRYYGILIKYNVEKYSLFMWMNHTALFVFVDNTRVCLLTDSIRHPN
jgi:hypothetical protein